VPNFQTFWPEEAIHGSASVAGRRFDPSYRGGGEDLRRHIIPDAAQPRRAESPPPGSACATRRACCAPPGVKPGGRVLFGKLSGTQITPDGRDLIMMKKADIVGVEKSAAKNKAA